MGALEIVGVLGTVGSVLMPFFDIPMIMQIRKRKSSSDISLIWTIGILSCALLMIPSALLSDDLNFKLFSIINAVLFGGVTFYVIKYRK